MIFQGNDRSVILPRRTRDWIAILMLFAVTPAFGELKRVIPPNELPRDRRLEPLKDLDGYFPFKPYQSANAWQERAESLRRQILVSQGLWPLPTRTPLNPVIHGKIERDDYTVERAYFESMPGFFVTGSLYRPSTKNRSPSGRSPGVLCPHGHWTDGRFYDAGAATAKKDIAQGAEKLDSAARGPLQARSIHLARLGCVVFHYDMIGYADSQQISYELAHRFAQQRPEMATLSNWGFFSPQAESHGQSIMGLQTWNSIRALDFLTSLPDVDPSRIGVTGASGGGTQTFILGAIDPRPATIFPAVMVSTAMQGGCTCENACGLRINTGNVEIAALFAPKPLGMSAADDWTKEMTTKGFPELQAHYRLMGAADNVSLLSRIEFPHNYNAVSREAMYGWFFKHLKLGDGTPEPEREFVRSTREELTVWDAQHPRPAGGPEFERQLLAWWKDDADQQLARLTPRDSESFAKFRSVVQPALDVTFGRGLPDAKDLAYDQRIKEDLGDRLLMAGVLRHTSQGEELPLLFLHPKKWNGEVVIWLHQDGKAGLFQDDQPRAEVNELVAAGKAVVGVDLLYQGEFLPAGKPLDKAPKVRNKREAAPYTYGYNHALFAQRVHDVLSVISFVKHNEHAPKTISLVGLGGVPGAWAAAARAQAGTVVNRTVVDLADFSFLGVGDIYSPDFLPGGAKYGDVAGMLAVAAPGDLWLASGSGEPPPLIRSAYQAAGARGRLVVHAGPRDAVMKAATAWLLTW